MTELKQYLGISELTQLCVFIFFQLILKINFIVDKVIEFEGLSYFDNSTVLCG